MRGRRLGLVACVLIGTVMCGCSTVRGYVGSRGADLMDILTLEGTIGPFLDAHVELTSLFGTGIGSSKQWGMAMRGRYVGLGGRNSGGFILWGQSVATNTAMMSVWGEEDYWPKSRTWFLLMQFPPILGPLLNAAEYKNFLDVEVGASAIVGVHVGVSPIEAIDFVLGILAIDLCGDDYYPEPPEEKAPKQPRAGAQPGGEPI